MISARRKIQSSKIAECSGISVYKKFEIYETRIDENAGTIF